MVTNRLMTVKFTLNPYVVAGSLVWVAASLYLQFFADLPLLRYGDQNPTGNRLQQLAVLLGFTPIMLYLAWRAGIKPIDHTSGLGISRRDALLETVWLGVYMVLTMGLGYASNIHSHIHLSAFADGTQTILGLEPLASSLVWAAYNFTVYAVIPLIYFRGMRKYSAESMLLKFPKPKTFVPFAVIVGLIGVVPLINEGFFTTSLLTHLLTLGLYSLGAIIPVAIFTQALMAPRLAILTQSWLSGTVLAGVAYALFNLNEYFLEWDSPEKVGLSLVTLAAGDFGWGVLKAFATLGVGNAWLHVFTTHTFHLADGPIAAKVFGFR